VYFTYSKTIRKVRKNIWWESGKRKYFFEKIMAGKENMKNNRGNK